MSKQKRSNGPIILDTSFLAALADTRDRHYRKACSLTMAYQNRPWVTTWPVLTELAHVISSRQLVNLLDAQQTGELFAIHPLDEQDLSRIATLIERYSKQRIDFADLSLIILAEYIESGDILTCDKRDFSILRWDRNRPFRNLWDT
ncbi:MAG: type II toxin-antitoxin system VapC family toxin [Parachlamydiales bacterium]